MPPDPQGTLDNYIPPLENNVDASTYKIDPELRKAVAAITPDGNWWSSSAQKTFEQLAARLIEEHDVPQDEAIELLSAAYGAVASEYGD